MFNNIRTKLIAAFLLIVLVPLIGTGLYGNWITSRVIRERAIEAARNDVRLHAEQVVSFLNHVRGDVLYLSRLASLEQLIDAQAEGDAREIDLSLAQVAQDFLIFSAARPEYYQVRYIAEDGQEMVRIDFDGRVSRSIPQEDLQNKGRRYYFQEAMQLPKFGIYVSPLDLNREQGAIEEPHTPVMRYATPVFDAGDQRQGVAIINVYAEQFLGQPHRSSSGRLIMANQDGYYLAHPDHARLWGGPNDLDTGHNIQRDYDEALTILSGTGDALTLDSRVVVFTTLYPVANDREHFWVIMRDESAASLLESVTSFRVTAVSILALAVFIAFIMALALSRQLTAPILALRQGVERFSREELAQPIPVQTDDEIGQLTAAFNDMAAVIQQHLTQLTKLTTAGQRISAGLERQVTLAAILEATQDLFAAEYCAISLTDTAVSSQLPSVAAQMGDGRWAKERETETVIRTGQRALVNGQWQTMFLSDKGGFFTCAPLSAGGENWGLIELYGCDVALREATCGSLLFTLAVESSIALENTELYETLGDHKRQLEELVEQLIDAQEAERKFVAYDLHDGLIQYLVAARLQLSKLTGIYADFPQDDKAAATLKETMAHLTQAVQEGRRVVEGLRPILLDDLGLAPALNELARDIGQATGWEVAFENQIGDMRLSPMVELTAFRVAQEALTNARKHALAGRVSVKLTQENGDLCVAVQDDGVGFDKVETRKHRQCIGLVSMRERVTLVDGDFSVESDVGGGTAVTIHLPIKNNND
ncbi:MAG: HAMP domain-containing protein [Chloroflexi bacterium]|nr:HAMP domain-containing protein [Chloroflexota bacterium]